MKACGLWKYKFTVVDVSVQLEVWCMSLGVKAFISCFTGCGMFRLRETIAYRKTGYTPI